MSAKLYDTLNTLLVAIGGVAVIVTALTAGAYGLFRLFAERWLKSRFDQQLEAFRHAQQKELEELRYKINALLDRALKLHQHEFDTLPDAWSRLNDSWGLALSVISPLQSYPDLDRMSAPQLEQFLASSPLDLWEQDELKGKSQKMDYYRGRIAWRRLAEAREKSRETHIFLRKNGIFILPSIRKKFDVLDEMIWDALVEHETNLTMNAFPRLTQKADALRRQSDALFKELEGEVQSRLWNAESIEARSLS
jgi:hypothetical protein